MHLEESKGLYSQEKSSKNEIFETLTLFLIEHRIKESQVSSYALHAITI